MLRSINSVLYYSYYTCLGAYDLYTYSNLLNFFLAFLL